MWYILAFAAGMATSALLIWGGIDLMRKLALALSKIFEG